jgi:CRP/FNR family cyclic AMP-dependent transcriptional regulator
VVATLTGIHLFEVEPDLLEHVPEPERQVARRSVVVAAQRLTLGPWTVDDVGAPRWGVLIIEGLIACEVGLAGTTAAELLGAGDVVLTGGPHSHEIMVPTETTWTVLEPATLAILDDRFQRVARRWPDVAACLLQRCEARAKRLALTEAISHLTRVDTRVLVMLWLLADRWGRVGTDGMVLPLRLTHRTLARLIGARRPSVTSAVTELSRRGLVARRDDGSWLLYGPPPAELDHAGARPAILATPAPAPTRRATPQPAAPQRPRRMGDPIRALVDGYDAQARLARTLGERAHAAREQSQALQDEVAQRRLRSARRSAPP